MLAHHGPKATSAANSWLPHRGQLHPCPLFARRLACYAPTPPTVSPCPKTCRLDAGSLLVTSSSTALVRTARWAVNTRLRVQLSVESFTTML
jgi:hypothetical protein